MSRNSFLYGLTDHKHPKKLHEISNKILKKSKQKNEPKQVGFTCVDQSIFKTFDYYDRDDLPRVAKTTPETLFEIASNLIDKWSIVKVYDWTVFDVCSWIASYGYPHFVNTFHVNLINGRKLLLLDASALSAMNIKCFADIQHIAYGIRCLFYFVLTKFSRSISLAPEHHYELFKLFRTKTGLKYELTKPSDLWHSIQLLRESLKTSHWDILEHWINKEPLKKYPELFGGVRREKLLDSKWCTPKKPPDAVVETTPCNCVPPCFCNERTLNFAPPSVLKCLQDRRKPAGIRLSCEHCVPPCECNWFPSCYKAPRILSPLNGEHCAPLSSGSSYFARSSLFRE